MPPDPVGLVLLGHGAGGGVDAPDLVAVARALVAAGAAVGLVTQPYRVAGRRAPAPAAALDEAWLAVAAALAEPPPAALPAGLPLVGGGRSSGARVACRTAAATGAAGTLALAFPLLPPPRPPRPPRPSRAPELAAALAAGPVLVVQGDADPFGGASDVAEAAPGARVHAVACGDHALRAGRPRRVPEGLADAAAAVVLGWLRRPKDTPGRAPERGIGRGPAGVRAGDRPRTRGRPAAANPPEDP